MDTVSDWEEGWKVVYTGLWPEGAWRSCSGVAHTVDYVPGEETRRPDGCGPLTVFGAFEHASDFIQMFGADRWEITKCRYIPSADRAVWNGDRRRALRHLPRGTVLADVIEISENAGWPGRRW